MSVIDRVVQTSASPLPAHAQSADGVAAELGVDIERGLSAEMAAKIRERVGCNRLAEAPASSRFIKFIRQFNELVIWVLIAAALVSGALGEWIDAIAIIAIVLLNGLLGFMQEERAGQAMAALRKLSSPKAKVMRNGGIISLPADDLVPGDRVELEAGDLIPADGRLISTISFSVDEASLTGESSAVEKDAALLLESNTSLADRRNMVYLGTTAARGRASVIITATGMQTELGRIAGMLQQQEIEPTPLQQRLAELGRTLVYVCLGIVTVIFVLQLIRHTKIQEAFLLAVSLAVAAIPEGLPAVVTIALALGLVRMVKRHALIRKLPSVETLGAVTVICSDKTGTLTRNEMTVREILAGHRQFEVTGSGYLPTGEFRIKGGSSIAVDDADLRRVLTIGAWCNTSQLTQSEETPNWHLMGDPTEGALIVAAMKAGIPAANEKHELLLEIPFDSDRKLMTVLALAADGKSIFYTKGAPEVALKCCKFEWVDGNEVLLTDGRRAEILSANADYASRALRVLGMAFRDGTGIPRDACVECDMTFAGLVGMVDPPRDEARAAVQTCHAAGIRPIMITGDHPDTAIAIARQLLIAGDDDRAVTGAQLDLMSDEQLGVSLRYGPEALVTERAAGVFARVTAEHKMRIVRALKGNGEIVAMTGDGVNDAPAVSAADIGIAMGRGGTDVTREAADMVLTDDNFASIVSAVEEGRGIFDNIRKFVQYLIGCNIGEVLFMFVGAVVGWQSPLNPIQILWINLVTDALPALALGIEAPEPGVMDRPPRPAKERVITRKRGLRMLMHGLLIAAVTVIGFSVTIRGNPNDWDRARTVAFCILSYSQLFYSFSCRSDRFTLPELGFFTNRKLIWAILISGLLQTAVFLPGARRIFHVEARMTWEWGLIFLLALLPVTVIEIAKIIKWHGRPARES